MGNSYHQPGHALFFGLFPQGPLARIAVLFVATIIVSEFDSMLLARLTEVPKADGTLDGSFDPSGAVGGTEFPNGIEAIVVQSDGKIVLGGEFTTARGVNIGRLNADGSLDANFIATANHGVYALALQSDGRIVLGGIFDKVNTVSKNFVARVNEDGTVDPTFTPDVDPKAWVRAIAVQPDGKIVLGLHYQIINEVAQKVVRLNPNGSRDTQTWNPGKAADSSVFAIALQSDGKVLFGGYIEEVAGVSRTGVARLNSDGSLDVNFAPNLGGLAWVTAIIVQPDQRILIAGDFNGVNGKNRKGLARLNQDGTVDESFNPAEIEMRGFNPIALAKDGRVIVQSAFGLKRLLPDGTVETSFTRTDFRAGDADVLALQPDGKIIVAGTFTAIGTVTRPGLARIYNTAGATPASPEIQVHPLSQIVSLGATVTFRVFASGEPAPRYQWRKDGTDIPAGTNSIYAIQNAQASHGGTYSVVVSNTAGSVTSSNATLTVGAPTLFSIAVSPPVTNVVAGGSVQFTATGRYNDGSSRVLIGSAGAWQLKAPMPTGRSTAHAVAINGLFYVVGGTNNGISDKLEAYNPATDKWTSLAPLPKFDTGEAGRNQGSAVALDGKLYLAGGWRTIPPRPTFTLLVYNPLNNTWSKQADLPTYSGHSVAGVIEGKFYLMTAALAFPGWQRVFHVHDPSKNTWAARASIPNVQVNGVGGIIDGKLYIAGGFNATATPISLLQVYDPTTDSWSTRSPMPTARHSAAGGVIDGRLYVAGGSNGSADVDIVEVYDPVPNAWSRAAPLSSPRSGMAATALDGKLYLAGGNNSSSTLEVFTPGEVKWTSSTTKVATINVSGLATGRTAGTATITASVRDVTGNAVLTVTLDSGAVAGVYTFITLAGSVSAGDADGIGPEARFSEPSGVAVDNEGNAYVADDSNHTIRKITPGGVVSTLAGSARSIGSTDGTGSAARFNYPRGVAVDTGGNVYVVDYENHTIRKVTPKGEVSTLAGSPGNRGSADGVEGAARFNNPRGVAVDGLGNVYVADYGNSTIRKITPSGTVTTLAGSVGRVGSTEGIGSAAQFNLPRGLAVDAKRNVYVADTGNHTIRKITTEGVVSTLAGSAGSNGAADGTGSAARFNSPRGLAVDSTRNVYVADTGNHTIRMITPDGVVSTVAGLAGSSGAADGTGSTARFYEPRGAAVDSDEHLYVADYYNNTIRKRFPISGDPGVLILVQPQSQTVVEGTSVTFGVIATGSSPLRYQWLSDEKYIIVGATNATLTLNNVRASDAGSYAVEVSNAADSVTSSTATLTVVNAPPTVRITRPTDGEVIHLDSLPPLFTGAPPAILLNALASDIDGVVTRVEFYAVVNAFTNLVGIRTGPLPGGNYGINWSNAPAGNISNIKLTAKAYDNLGASSVSQPVSIIVFAIPQKPTFRFERSDYQVSETNGFLELKVIKDGDGSGTVSLYTEPVGPTPAAEIVEDFGDYVLGRSFRELFFSSFERTQTIRIGIVDDLFIEGPESFRIGLKTAIPGAALGNPSTALIGIADNDDASVERSSLVSRRPDPRPRNRGAVKVTLKSTISSLQPNPRWHFPWELFWRNSGSQASDLVEGSYEIEFEAIPGHYQLPRTNVFVVTNSVTSFTFSYLPTSPTPHGTVTVNLRTLNQVQSDGAWQRDGESAWHKSGESIPLPAGPHLIRFRPLSNSFPPKTTRVLIVKDQGIVITGAYLPASAKPSSLAALNDFQQITDGLDLVPRLPYAFNGQLLTDTGSGSGFVVARHVVLTAAHVVFDEVNLGYTPGIEWYFQRHIGEDDQKPQRPRGAFVLDGYAAQRQGDHDNRIGAGISSVQAYNRDVAALYFADPAGRNGYGGYLSSDAIQNEWLSKGVQKLLVGYPVVPASAEGEAMTGRMHFLGPLPNVVFVPIGALADRVYTADKFISLSGNSGGPIYALSNGTDYYPAGVYLGALDTRSVVRAIDKEVVRLVNRAASAAAASQVGTNQNFGVPTGAPSEAQLKVRDGTMVHALRRPLSVRLGPPEAVLAGAAWMIPGRVNYFTNAPTVYLTTETNYQIQFSPAKGFQTPATRSVGIGSESSAEILIEQNYTPLEFYLTNLMIDGGVRMTLVAPEGKYQLESRPAFAPATPWLNLRNVVVTNGNLTIDALPLLTNRPSQFFRVRLIE